MDISDLWPGLEVALGRQRYRILEGPVLSRTGRIGHLSMTYAPLGFARPEVYRARTLRGRDRTVALKVARREAHSWLRVEYEALRRLRRADLAPRPLHGIRPYGGLSVLAMEWLKPQEWYPLTERLDDWHTELPDQNAFAKVLLYAVQRLHAAGVAHGDLTDTNIFVSEDWARVRFIDFGLSMVGRFPRRGHGGTVGFSAPELATQTRELDLLQMQRADIYAACAVLYYLETEECYPLHGPVYRDLKRTGAARSYEDAVCSAAEQRLRRGVDWELRQVLLDGLRAQSDKRPPIEELLRRLKAGGARLPLA